MYQRKLSDLEGALGAMAARLRPHVTLPLRPASSEPRSREEPLGREGAQSSEGARSNERAQELVDELQALTGADPTIAQYKRIRSLVLLACTARIRLLVLHAYASSVPHAYARVTHAPRTPRVVCAY